MDPKQYLEFLKLFKKEEYILYALTIISIWYLEPKFENEYLKLAIIVLHFLSATTILGIVKITDYKKDKKYFEYREQKRLEDLRKTFEEVAEQQCQLPFSH